jgi:predicted MPP superfamily phosphohydrolase
MRALEARIGRLHLQYRLGLERQRDASMHGDAWYDTPARERLGRMVANTLARTLRLHPQAESDPHGTLRDVHVEIPVAGLDARLDGFRIAHLSDLYADRSGDLMALAASRLAAHAPDLCVLTGDYCEAATGPAFETALARMAAMLAPLSVPVLAVLGDRDSLDWLPALERIGLRVLVNESIAVEHDGARLHLSGVDDPHFFKADDVQAALQTIPTDATSILLAHSPEVFARAAEAGFDVLLSGHTLGGRYRLPGGTPLMRRTRAPRVMCRGRWRFGPLQGYTSAGCGLPQRRSLLDGVPEIAFHTLRCAPKPQDTRGAPTANAGTASVRGTGVAA